jgi:chemotaxis protein MotB
MGFTGCSMQALKDQNRRLKESNDRLISENNRLEEELAALQRRSTEGQVALTPPPMPEVADTGKPVKVGRSALLDDIRDEVEVAETQQGIRLRVPDRVFFALGQAALSAQGQRILDKVARLINGYPNHLVRVDGHTDDTPIRKVRHIYPTNWELSSARACTVVRYLVDKGNVNARRIFPAGFSYYHPVSTGKGEGSKSQNRRVEITILNDSA